MEHIVEKGCKGCPLFDNEYSACNHPERSKYPFSSDCSEAWWNDTTPDWCPLKKEPITISIDNNGR